MVYKVRCNKIVSTEIKHTKRQKKNTYLLYLQEAA